jgi:hypothetical protein
MDKVSVIETYDADGKEWGISLDGPNPHPDKYFTMPSKSAAMELANLINQPAASPVREAAENILHLHLCEQEGLQSGQPTPQMWMEAVDKLSEALAARTEGDGEGEGERHFWPYESLRNEIAELKKQLGEQEKIKEGMQLTIDSLIANNDERNSK